MTIHPLLRLIATQPHLLADHAEAYAGLVSDEISRTAESLKMRAILFGIAGVLGLLAVGLAGVAVLFWAALPASMMRAPWALVAAPALPLVIAIGCVVAARGQSASPFEELKQQLAADLGMLRDVSAA